MVQKHSYPEPARTEILALQRHILMLNDFACILHYMYTPSAYEYYNQLGTFNLRAIPWLIHDTLITGIGKLTDPAETRGEKNLNFKTLAKTIVQLDSKNQKLADRIMGRLNKVDIRNIRYHRNKRVAHADYSVHIDNAKMPRYSQKTIERILSDLAKILDAVSKKVLGMEIMYSNEHYIADEAQRFLNALDRGLNAKK